MHSIPLRAKLDLCLSSRRVFNDKAEEEEWVGRGRAGVLRSKGCGSDGLSEISKDGRFDGFLLPLILLCS